MSAMRMSAGAAFVNVDDRAVFGRCLPRWEIARFVSTSTRPPATWSVGKHRLLVQAQLSAMRTVAPIYSSWVQTNDGCRRGCPQCGVWPGCGIGGCAPMMGASGVVRNAESEPVSGCCGCVVGRVVEVEFVGVCGRTRRPVLDFRPAVGIVVAAVPATYVAPRWQVASRRVISPRGFHGCAPMMGAGVVVRNAELHPGLSWVSANSWCIWCCPQCGV